MATLALAAVGAAVGGAVLPAGLSVLGVAISGAAIGTQIGTLAGSYVDQSLFGSSGQSRAVDGPRLSDLSVTTSTEGAAIPRLYGQARLGGQVIWALAIEEEAVTTEAGGGGKGGSGSSGGDTRTDYAYYGSFAVGIAEGELSALGRIWADGREMDLANIAYRFYSGSETQLPDSLVEAHVGGGMTPAFRGLAYIVFERLPLARYGNRLPQLAFEVSRPADDFQSLIRGIVMIPGSGEFVYSTTPQTRDGNFGSRVAENVHTIRAQTDWAAALDQLQSELPNVDAVSLVVSWFGTDLRAGQCEIRPGVERAEKDSDPQIWSVNGQSRDQAYLVSTKDGRPAYGGTPSDASSVQAIQDLKSRGIAVTLTPFVLMDVPDANGRTDPYTGNGNQPSYPWRGRITVDPAPGRPGSPDKTAAAATQLLAFVGTAQPSQFSIQDGTIAYGGPPEWSYRRFVLHHAYLALLAGGVDTFVIGTELQALTKVRSSASVYPFVGHLTTLAAEVKSILGASTKVTYAADWTEYFGHQPQDGTGDVYFHLDPLWASPSIDAVAIDAYWPLADWRDWSGHADQNAGIRSNYDLDYLKSNLAGGEGFDWYYVSAADRLAQVRTPITDGAGKPWVFRTKDLKSWWENAHFNRPGGVEQPAPTAWVPGMKPVWLMEIGCPAVDKGANQPNVFFDPKSSESALPYYSTGRRDDLMQRVYLRAILEAFDPAHPAAVAGLNPISSVYGGRMVDTSRIFAYAWDARPYPAFPRNTTVWGDAANWRLGHWLTGRLAGIPLAACVSRILEDHGFFEYDASQLAGLVPGYVVDRVMSARDALQALELAYFFDSVETGGSIHFRHRGGSAPALTVSGDTVVESRPGADLYTLTRGQETELPASAKVAYVSSGGDYRQAVAEARRLAGGSRRVAQAELPIVLESEQAGEIAESWLHESWAARERLTFVAPPSALAIEPGDTVALAGSSRARLFRVTEVGERGAREISALSLDPSVYVVQPAAVRPQRILPAVSLGRPDVVFLDLPQLAIEDSEVGSYIAASRTPWPGSVAVYRSPEATGFTLAAIIPQSAVIGVTRSVLNAGPVSRIDKGARVTVEIQSGALQSVTRLKLLSGANAAAVETSAGSWEIVQFENAGLIAPQTYELSGLLRGQLGTEHAIAPSIAAGARFVVLGPGLKPLPVSVQEIRAPFQWRVGPANRDVGSPDYVATSAAFSGRGLSPLAPVRLRAARDNGDIVLSWIRRTRTNGDGWEPIDVPLGEVGEGYQVEILDGSTVKRVLETSQPNVTYSSALQIADFGGPQPNVTVRVYQMSATVGRGIPATATI